MLERMLLRAAGASGGQVTPTKTPWDITTMTFEEAESIGRAYTVAVFFKSDASVMYTLQGGSLGDTVTQHNMNASFPYELSYETIVASYTIPSSNQPNGMFFKSDGSKMYIADVNVIKTFSLSTAWDISSASLSDSQAIFASLLYFRSDGSKMYTASSGDVIYEYNLSTPWDVSTASSQGSFDTNIGGAVEGLFFKPDGSSLYLSYGSTIMRYNLSTPWDVSTSVFEVTKGGVQGEGIFFSPTGNDLLIADNSQVRRYDL